MKLYRIKDWATAYENNRTRELKRLDWVPIPNRHDGEGYTLTATRSNGAELLGAWLAIIQVASRCGTRGTLMRDTAIPHDAVSISRISRLSVKSINAALSWFASSEVQWLEIVNQEGQLELPAGGCDNPAPCCGNPAGGCLEEKGREGNRKKGRDGCADGSAPASDSEWLASLQASAAYRSIPVASEYDKMNIWCATRKQQPTRRRFLAWLNRIEKPMTRATGTPVAASIPEPEGWKAYWRGRYPPEDFPQAPRYEDGQWQAVRRDHQQEISKAMTRTHQYA